MTIPEKPAYPNYSGWLEKEHGAGKPHTWKTHYETVANRIHSSFEDTEFWRSLLAQRNKLFGDYYAKTGYPLWAEGEKAPVLLRKPYDSFLRKTYRKNILGNVDWPKPPEGGWLLPPRWFPAVKDIVRTSLVVKYLDGVEFAATQIASIAQEAGLTSTVEYEARNEGYYAAHLSIWHEFEIPTLSFDTVIERLAVEVQITTQVQEVIRNLLHKHYEVRRMSDGANESKWQWDFRSPEFATNYLGHILHYVEGMIMEIREAQHEQRGAR